MQADHKDFRLILEKYLDGSATEEEKVLLAAYFESEGPYPQQQMTDAQWRQMEEEIRQFTAGEEVRKVRKPLYRRIPVVRWAAAAAAIIVIATSVWMLLLNRNQSTAVAFNEIITSKGETRVIKLPDSSEITLNANTTLRYAANFKKDRSVTLSGEAFFSVTKDPSHPFRIQLSDSLQVEVLGTSFNVSDYRRSAAASVLVTDGAVKVQQASKLLGVLHKNRQLTFDRRSGLAAVKSIGPSHGEGWKTGVWKYDGMSIADLEVLLENQFGVSLVNKTGKELSTITDASLNFSRQQSPKEIVAVFCSVSSYKCTWINNQTVELH